MKNKVITLSFIAILAAFLIATIILPDKDVSYTERRTLAKFPELSFDTVADRSFQDGLEKYMPDHFAAREELRQTALLLRTKVLLQRDYKGIFVDDGYACNTVYPYDKASVSNLAQKINTLADYFTGSNTYASIIPDKSLYSNKGNLCLDFDTMQSDLSSALTNTKYIDISDSLSLSDYYKTDVHWRQENLNKTVKKLGDIMKFNASCEYTKNSYSPFYGSYYSRAAGLLADELIYLESEFTKNAYVDDIQNPDHHEVYSPSSLGKMDSYDVFLSGATPLSVITNKTPTEAAKGRELIIFRDSFGSSIAPLLLPAYERITLVDLRYMSSKLLPEYITPKGQDVLFLYGMELANESMLLK